MGSHMTRRTLLKNAALAPATVVVAQGMMGGASAANNYGNIRPQGSNDNGILLGWAPAGQLHPPWPVDLLRLPSGYGNMQWFGIPVQNQYFSIQTRYTALGQFYLTMNSDNAGQPVWMAAWNESQKWAQLWIPIKWSANHYSFETNNGNILQAVNLNQAPSQVIVGSWPERNTNSPQPKTLGQIWLISA
jgi:hypothetical protein